MMGRIDVELRGCCDLCGGSGRDPCKRKRSCPKCRGTGKALVCTTCGERMPCSGTDPNIFDQASCNKGRSG